MLQAYLILQKYDGKNDDNKNTIKSKCRCKDTFMIVYAFQVCLFDYITVIFSFMFLPVCEKGFSKSY